jgi:hypothetical protein
LIDLVLSGALDGSMTLTVLSLMKVPGNTYQWKLVKPRLIEVEVLLLDLSALSFSAGKIN